ncbi:hypothetical protein PG985_013218 [Apiospora marii]|uniref:Uncharacterized protein n=1 Tax=Apiospora marii TaxID=335849 RepID=A0ABR1R976_9PEZI
MASSTCLMRPSSMEKLLRGMAQPGNWPCSGGMRDPGRCAHVIQFGSRGNSGVRKWQSHHAVFIR